MQMSIIIVAYNSNDVLLPCLDSIDQHNPFGMDLEVIVVDNNPDAGLQQLLSCRQFAYSLQYLPCERNGGFGAGNNVGVKHATSDIVLFLNPDTIILSDVFTQTCSRINADPDSVIGYTLVTPDGQHTDSYSFFFEYFWLFPLFALLRRIDYYFVNHLPMFRSLCWPWGAAFALCKSRFIDAGMFDEQMFLCNEEPDLMHRLPHRHIHILNERIVHLEGHGRVVSEERYYQSLKSLHYYFQKHNIWETPYWAFLKFKLHLGNPPENFRNAVLRFTSQTGL